MSPAYDRSSFERVCSAVRPWCRESSLARTIAALFCSGELTAARAYAVLDEEHRALGSSTRAALATLVERAAKDERETIAIRDRAGELLLEARATSVAEVLRLQIDRGASLDGANLESASLVEINLDGASLIGASLAGANLVGANLAGTSLYGARLDGAKIDASSFEDADLEPIREALLSVLSRGRSEVPALLALLREGRVEGSACLTRSVVDVAASDAPQGGSAPDRWLLAIRSGDTPSTSALAAITERWIVDWCRANGVAVSP